MSLRLIISLCLATACVARPLQEPRTASAAPPLTDSEGPAPVSVASEPPALQLAIEPVPAPLVAAMAAGLDYLARDGAAWMHGESPLNAGNGCISCHVVGFALWSHHAATNHGLSVNRDAIERLTEEALDFIAAPGKGRAVTWSQLMLGRPVDSSGYDWPTMVEGMVASRERSGHWRARGQFPTQRRPIEESDAVATMWSLLGLSAVDGVASLGESARGRALAWLEESDEGVSSEWLAMRLLTANLIGAQAETEGLLARLLDAQRPEGGWSWLLEDGSSDGGAPANAYSTGVALYALRRAGLPAVHPAVQEATTYLLRAQLADGTWDVPSRLVSAEPSDAKDYVYEYWGTAWAVIGLAEMLPTRSEF